MAQAARHFILIALIANFVAPTSLNDAGRRRR
jgi:hypothetical protein